MKKDKKKTGETKEAVKVEDLPATETGKVRGGSSNIMKTKHDTVKNSISNVR